MQAWPRECRGSELEKQLSLQHQCAYSRVNGDGVYIGSQFRSHYTSDPPAHQPSQEQRSAILNGAQAGGHIERERDGPHLYGPA